MSRFFRFLTFLFLEFFLERLYIYGLFCSVRLVAHNKQREPAAGSTQLHGDRRLPADHTDREYQARRLRCPVVSTPARDRLLPAAVPGLWPANAFTTVSKPGRDPRTDTLLQLCAGLHEHCLSTARYS